jgi:hypothetical protein
MGLRGGGLTISNHYATISYTVEIVRDGREGLIISGRYRTDFHMYIIT